MKAIVVGRCPAVQEGPLRLMGQHLQIRSSDAGSLAAAAVRTNACPVAIRFLVVLDFASEASICATRYQGLPAFCYTTQNLCFLKLTGETL